MKLSKNTSPFWEHPIYQSLRSQNSPSKSATDPSILLNGLSSQSSLNSTFTYFTLHVQPRLLSSSFADAAVAEHVVLLLPDLHKTTADTFSLPSCFFPMINIIHRHFSIAILPTWSSTSSLPHRHFCQTGLQHRHFSIVTSANLVSNIVTSQQLVINFTRNCVIFKLVSIIITLFILYSYFNLLL